jgi:tetratricopeptide (TPR) repeat protein
MCDDARSLFERALSIDSGNDKAANNLGVLSFELGDRDSARHFFIRAVELNPDNELAKANLAGVLDGEVSRVSDVTAQDSKELCPPGAVPAAATKEEAASASIPVCSDPIFVVGSPRSGTSQLARSLARHSENWISRESHFLNHLGALTRELYSLGTQWCEVSDTWWLAKEQVTVDEMLRFVGYGINALFTDRSSGLRWIDHTPGYAIILRDLGVTFPGAQFIHMVRDGRDVVNSMIHSQHHRTVGCDWATDFLAACRTWAAHVEAALEYERANPNRILRVYLEAVSTGRSDCFKRILHFLQLPYEETTTELFKEGKRLNSSFSEAEREKLSWRNSWSREQRAEFASICGPLLVMLGYETDDSWADSAQPGVSQQRS